MAPAPHYRFLRRALTVGLPCLLGVAAAATLASEVGAQPASTAAPAADWAPEAKAQRDRQRASLVEYAPAAAPGTYHVPVDRAIELVVASPALLKPIALAISAGATPEERGAILFNKVQPCYTCHATSAADTLVKLGPPLHGRFGGIARFAGGTAPFDEAYITESIKNPLGKISEGFPPIMPPLSLPDDQVADIVAYLKTLK